MDIAKIIIRFPNKINNDLTQYIRSCGFVPTSQLRGEWIAAISEKSIACSEKINNLYQKEIRTIVKFFSPPPDKLKVKLKNIGYVYYSPHQNWYGAKSMISGELDLIREIDENQGTITYLS
jgi:hypothetical protein